MKRPPSIFTLMGKRGLCDRALSAAAHKTGCQDVALAASDRAWWNQDRIHRFQRMHRPLLWALRQSDNRSANVPSVVPAILRAHVGLIAGKSFGNNGVGRLSRQHL